MDLENSKAQMKKGVLEYCTLAVLSGGAAYANDIIERLRGSDLVVVEGTIYPLLTRMKNEGLLAYRWEESTMGPPRKYYELTENGRAFLLELHKTWRDFTGSVEKIVKHLNK